MKLFRSCLLSSVLVLTAAACDKGDDQARAAKAKEEAAAKVADAEREAAQKKADAQRELAEAEAKAQKERADARAELQKQIAADDRKALDLKERLAKAKGKVKLNAEAASTEYDKRRGVVERDIESLNTATGAAWDTLKAQTSKDLDSLKASLDAFDKTLS